LQVDDVACGGDCYAGAAIRQLGRPFVVKNNIGALITNVQVSPVFLKSTYLVGGSIPGTVAGSAALN
jgi:hypothetical protein